MLGAANRSVQPLILSLIGKKKEGFYLRKGKDGERLRLYTFRSKLRLLRPAGDLFKNRFGSFLAAATY